MVREELINTIRREIMGLSSNFEQDDYDNAVNEAERETGFAAADTAFRIRWLKERAKRHLFFSMQTAAADDFKYKAFNLQHRFDHYIRMVRQMDKDFKEVQESYPHEFAQVNAVQALGTKIDAGFSYDSVGQETTYDDNQQVIVNPTDSD